MCDDSRLSILNVAVKLNLQVLRRTGTEWLARCPFCGDSQNPRHGHLYLNIRENKYYCVRCGEGGYAIGLYARMKGIDTKRAYRELLGMEDETPSGMEVVKMKTCEIADIEIRHRTYSAFLDMLELEFQHMSDLKRRGLTVKQIKEKGYKSIPQGEKCYNICKKLIEAGYTLEGVPGFYKKDGRWTCYDVPGYLIPVRDGRGRIQGLQVRLDEPGNGGKYRWFSSRDQENGTPAESWVHIARGQTKEVWLTEGPLKADIAAYLSGHTFVAIPGVTSIKYLVPALRDIKARRVVLAVDMDILTNPQVKAALEKIEQELKRAGIKTARASWNPAAGKGIDDALLSGATIEVTGTKPSLLARIFGA
jgi:hypothetical protein